MSRSVKRLFGQKLKNLKTKKFLTRTSYLVTVSLFAFSIFYTQHDAKAASLPTIRVNAGGSAYTDSYGHFWEADSYYNTGMAASITNEIAGTNDDALYQSERWDPNDATPLQYAFDVPNGSYQVKLHFAEIHSWAGPWRFFDASVQDQTVLSNFNVQSEAGDKYTALVKSFTAEVVDGQLTVGFAHGSNGNPKISAIEVIGRKLPIFRINAGGSQYTDTQGNVWHADQYYAGGFANSTTNTIANTDNDILYQSERWQWTALGTNMHYAFAVPNGNYQVRLHFAEFYAPTSQVGARVFDVGIEDSTVLDDFDIFGEAGANTALAKEFTANVADGELKIEFINGTANNPKISAIEIIGEEMPLPVNHVSGTLASSQTWTKDAVWYIDNTVTVPEGKTLTIDPGTIVKVNGPYLTGITVESGGILEANGTTSDKVIFTSHKDDNAGGDSNSNGLSTGADNDYTIAINVIGGVTTIENSILRYGGAAVEVSCPGGTEEIGVTLKDNAFNNSVGISNCQQGAVIMQRNHFSVTETHPIYLSNSKADNTIAITGIDRNTFSGTGRSVALRASNVEVPANSTWTVDNEGGLQVLYVYSTANINGTLTIGAGSIVKTHGPYLDGISVNQGGALDVNGASNDQVIFTSFKDDGAGGDSNGDGFSSGSSNDYPVAVLVQGGALSIEHAVMRNGGESVDINCQNVTGTPTLLDSTLNSTVGISHCQQGSVVLERNHFEVPDDHPIYAIDVHANIIPVAGADKNTFVGNGRSGAVYLQNSEIPENSSWAIGNGTSLQVLRIDGAVRVNGTLTLNSGSIVKIRDQYQDGVHVNTGGTLDVAGTSDDKVIFTSEHDDAVGGDSNGNGNSNGSAGNYWTAIQSLGGIVDVEHAIIRNVKTSISADNNAVSLRHLSIDSMSNTAMGFGDADAFVEDASITNAATGIFVSGGQANFAEVDVSNVNDGLVVQSNAQVTFRGNFSSITSRAVKACNWGGDCAVDAAYTDWGSANGPFVASGTDLVCGSVQAFPWIYNGATYNGSGAFSSRNCDGSPAPDEQLSQSINYFMQRKNLKQIDCDNGLQDACQAIQTAMACLAGAVNTAASTSPIPLPEVEEDWQIQEFGENIGETAFEKLVTSATAAVTPGTLGTTFLVRSITGTFFALSGAYSSCAP